MKYWLNHETGDYDAVDEITYERLMKHREQFNKMSADMMDRMGIKPTIQIMSTMADDSSEDFKDLWNNKLS